MRRALCSGLFLAAVALPLLAQQGASSVGLIPRSSAEREMRMRADRHVLLNVVVTDPSGKPVSGLTAEDFTLLDNERAQQPTSFKAVEGVPESARIHVLLVLDELNDSPRGIGLERTAIESYLRRSGGRLLCPVSIAVLSGAGMTVGGASRDGSALIDELKRLPRERRGDDGEELPKLNRRFQTSVGALIKLAGDEQQMPGRAIVVWLGPGWPMLADPKFKQDTVEKQRNFFAHVVDLSTGLRESQMALYNVSTAELSRGAEAGKDLYKQFLGGVATAKQVNSANLALPVLAYQSGGRIMDAGGDLAGEIAASTADANGYYVLAFDAAPGGAVDEYHSLQVKMNRPGMTARTNRGYYAQP